MEITKYFDLSMIVFVKEPQIFECSIAKGLVEIESLLLKGKDICLTNYQGKHLL